MLNLQAIEAQLAKGDPKLKDVYLKLKAEAEGASAQESVSVESGDGLRRVQEPEFPQYTTPDMVDNTVKRENFSCSKCQKICANGTGLSAHERKCKA